MQSAPKTKNNILNVRIIISIGIIFVFTFSFVNSSMVVYAICPGGVCPPGTDRDLDGLTNEEELEIYHTDPRLADTDRDALKDGREVGTTFTNPLVPDTDREGLLDGKEVNGWYYAILESVCPDPSGYFGCVIYKTNPLNPDTDGDRCTDHKEWHGAADPNNPNVPPPDIVAAFCVNTPPQVQNQIVSTLRNTQKVITLSGTDANPGDRLAFSISSAPTVGTLSTITSTGPTSAQVTYTPKPGFTGITSFAVVAWDGKASGNTATVTVNVLAG